MSEVKRQLLCVLLLCGAVLALPRQVGVRAAPGGRPSRLGTPSPSPARPGPRAGRRQRRAPAGLPDSPLQERAGHRTLGPDSDPSKWVLIPLHGCF